MTISPRPRFASATETPAASRAGRTAPSAGGGAAPGLAAAAVGVALAWLAHRAVPALPMLTAAIALGVLAANLPGPSRRLVAGPVCGPGLAVAGRRLMRLGVVLLGLRLSLSDIAGLGWLTPLMTVGVLLLTLLATRWLGRRLGLPGDQPLLVATGFAICGASAIGAMAGVTRSKDEDVAPAVALVTLCGTLAIAVLPALNHLLGLDPAHFGRWVGASVHDVGQVVATAQTDGPVALSQAVVVKLTRVAMLAPVVAGAALHLRRRARSRTGSAPAAGERRPPVLPLFVAGFLLAVALRSTGWLPAGVLDAAHTAQNLVLAAALVGLGAAVDLPRLVRGGGRLLLLGLVSWTVIAGLSYLGVRLIG